MQFPIIFNWQSTNHTKIEVQSSGLIGTLFSGALDKFSNIGYNLGSEIVKAAYKSGYYIIEKSLEKGFEICKVSIKMAHNKAVSIGEPLKDKLKLASIKRSQQIRIFYKILRRDKELSISNITVLFCVFSLIKLFFIIISRKKKNRKKDRTKKDTNRES